MTRVAVTGALGRMGALICRAVEEDDELRLTGAVDPKVMDYPDGAFLLESGARAVEAMGDLDPAETDVMVEFSHASAAVENVNWALKHGIHCVIGTTGLPQEVVGRIREAASSGDANVVMAANFAPGAVLMMKFSEMAASVFGQCEIIELHHSGKLDAPSGTALATSRRIEAAMKERAAEEAGGAGSRSGVKIHSVRLDGLVAHQQVIFGSTGETFSIRHDAIDRTCFMPGILLAAKAVRDRPGFTFGIEELLRL